MNARGERRLALIDNGETAASWLDGAREARAERNRAKTSTREMRRR